MGVDSAPRRTNAVDKAIDGAANGGVDRAVGRGVDRAVGNAVDRPGKAANRAVDRTVDSTVARTPEPLPDGDLRPCEAKLLAYIRNHWALEFGTREVRLVIEYQNGVPVLIRVTGNIVREEKLR
ncbi:MAG: hypothetical protein K6W08_08750 [Firmicutes bacterium]|nr:hypothetical protein [Bacillota bacterium]